MLRYVKGKCGQGKLQRRSEPPTPGSGFKEEAGGVDWAFCPLPPPFFFNLKKQKFKKVKRNFEYYSRNKGKHF